jgi:hypothetical protein
MFLSISNRMIRTLGVTLTWCAFAVSGFKKSDIDAEHTAMLRIKLVTKSSAQIAASRVSSRNAADFLIRLSIFFEINLSLK